MPSLPELEVYKRQFADEIIGRPITKVEPLDFRVVREEAGTLERALVGHAIANISRYGKWLYFDTGAPEQLVVHLGLTGKLRLLALEDKLPRNSSFTIGFSDNRRLVMSDQRHLGKIYVRDFDGLKTEKKLGPDLMDIDENYFTDVLGHKKRAVRDVLMDQHVVAGIGGKYADEILWQAKIHPSTKLDTLSQAQLTQLYQLTRIISDTAISLNADVDRFPDSWLIPHRRTDQICPRCGSALADRSTGGSATFYCPHCQPAPNPSPRG